MHIAPSRHIVPALTALIAAAVFSMGCVTKGKYQELQTDRDQLAAENADLTVQRQELRSELSVASDQVSDLGDRLQEKQAILDEQQATYNQVVNELEGELEAGKIAVQLMKNGINVRISEELLFASGAAKLEDSGVAVVTRLGNELKATPYQIVVGGYTDNVPIGGALARTYPTNWDLAGARAAHVVRALEESGVPSVQLLAVSFGENDPVAPNDSADGRAKNRRIEVRIRPVEADEVATAAETAAAVEASATPTPEAAETGDTPSP